MSHPQNGIAVQAMKESLYLRYLGYTHYWVSEHIIPSASLLGSEGTVPPTMKERMEGIARLNGKDLF